MYGYGVFWISIVFFSVYPFCNWITSQRTDVYRFYAEAELAIPFWPHFIWPYLSMYILFLLPPFFLHEARLSKLGKEISLATVASGIVFLLFPSVLGFERVLPDNHYAQIYENIFLLDYPHNMVPSLHIVYSGLILLAVFQTTPRVVVKIVSFVWFALIALSTLWVHQHHIADIFSGIIVVSLFNHYIKEVTYDQGNRVYDFAADAADFGR
jgi:membrane-associated phospholipid phosphatase